MLVWQGRYPCPDINLEANLVSVFHLCLLPLALYVRVQQTHGKVSDGCTFEMSSLQLAIAGQHKHVRKHSQVILTYFVFEGQENALLSLFQMVLGANPAEGLGLKSPFLPPFQHKLLWGVTAV